MLPRHEVPTHLHVEDRVFFGFMTVRHVLVLAGGCFLAMGAVLSPPLPLPEFLRYLCAVAIGAATLAVAFVEPDGRKMEEWLFAFLRYQLTPRVAVWRPCGEEWGQDEGRRGALVLTAGADGSAPERRTTDAGMLGRERVSTAKAWAAASGQAAQRLPLTREG
jgi:hypothetical protein